MTDSLTSEQRHRCMSRIKSKDTGPELLLRKALWREGLRYRLYSKSLPGKPDVVFVSAKVAIFIDGCFWHGCPQHGGLPKTNRDFWRQKIYRNIQRDRDTGVALEAMGWKVLRFWQHELKDNLNGVTARIRQFVKPDGAKDRAVYQTYHFEPAYTIADVEGEYRT